MIGGPTGREDGARHRDRQVTDRAFDVLSHAYRRRVLTILADADPSDDAAYSIRDFAAEGDDADRFELALHHAHLPKLDEAGYVDWDHESDVVRHGPRFDQIEPFVSILTEWDD